MLNSFLLKNEIGSKNVKMILGELRIFKKLLQDRIVGNSLKKRCRTIPLEELEKVQVFHVTHCKNRASILRHGLLCRGQPTKEIISYEPRVFVSSTYEEAAFDFVGFEDVDVWTFYIHKVNMNTDEFAHCGNHYFLKNDVPWYKLNLLETRI